MERSAFTLLEGETAKNRISATKVLEDLGAEVVPTIFASAISGGCVTEDAYRYLSDKFSTPATPETEYLFKTVVENYSKNSMSAHFKLQGAMNLILSDFVSDVKAAVPELVKFDEVLRYIDNNYRRNISVAELAAIMNISSMYFSNYFKRVFHISPKQYILNKRLMESQRLLLESRMSIKEIAFEVGFDNENYFSEFFSSKVGISALKFRKRELPTTRDSIL